MCVDRFRGQVLRKYLHRLHAPISSIGGMEGICLDSCGIGVRLGTSSAAALPSPPIPCPSPPPRGVSSET